MTRPPTSSPATAIAVWIGLGLFVAAGALAAWLVTSAGVALLAPVVVLAGLLGGAARIGRRHRHRLSDMACAVVCLSVAALSGTFGLSIIAVLGVGGRQSSHSVDWPHPELAWLPHLALAAMLVVLGGPVARRVGWIRSLQSRSDDHPGRLHDRSNRRHRIQ